MTIRSRSLRVSQRFPPAQHVDTVCRWPRKQPITGPDTPTPKLARSQTPQKGRSRHFFVRYTSPLTVTTATFLSPRLAIAFLTLMAALNLAPE